MLEILNIHKVMGGQSILKGIDLKLAGGEFVSLLGPSGCGKTTLLRILAGFETPDLGSLVLDGEDVTHLTPQRRPFNMIFQKYALFPHMTVEENVGFGLRLKNIPRSEIVSRARKLLDMVGLSGLESRKPETLSGGQAQRVAVARALANEPRVLLLDEPLSALDQKMREHMQVELRALQRRLGIIFVFVTHDQDEALAMSDRIAIMNLGRLEQLGTPQDLFAENRSEFVLDFVGSAARVSGVVQEVTGARIRLRLENGTDLVGFPIGRDAIQVGAVAHALIRSDKVGITGASR